MKNLITIFAVIMMFGFVTGPTAFAQQGGMRKGGGGWGHGSSYGKMYNPETVEKIRGEVVSLDKMMLMKGMSHGIHAVIKTESETISVHLGPEWYIDNQDGRIEPGDTIEVKGSRITFDGKPVIVAAEVKRGDEVLVLRDKNGIPVWSGWRQK
jgi:hypothetical protein